MWTLALKPCVRSFRRRKSCTRYSLLRPTRRFCSRRILTCSARPRRVRIPILTLAFSFTAKAANPPRCASLFAATSTRSARKTGQKSPAFAALSPSEMFSVPLYRLRTWLQNENSPDTTGDVEGESGESEQPFHAGTRAKFLIYRGREDSTVSDNPAAIYPTAPSSCPHRAIRKASRPMRKARPSLVRTRLWFSKVGPLGTRLLKG